MILSQSIGDYSQTIRVNRGDNEVRISRGHDVLYDGIAYHIIDKDNLITFLDKDKKEHSYQKYPVISIS